MKVRLLHREKDFELYVPSTQGKYVRRQDLDRDALLHHFLWNAPALVQDLELDVLLHSMAGGDEFVFDVAQQALLSGMRNDAATILYRQAVLKDCLKNPTAVRGLFELMTDIEEATRRQWWNVSSEYPGSMLYSSIELLETFIGVLRKLRTIAEEAAGNFASEGFTALFAMVRKELSEEYLDTIKQHLTELKFRKGLLLSAELGPINEGTGYMLRKSDRKEPNWLDRLLGKHPQAYTFHLDPHDEAGGRILTDIRSVGIARVALALSQSSAHVLDFFKTLRTELAFYVSCLNLHEELESRAMPVVFPDPRPPGTRCHAFAGLYDVCLALTMNAGVVGNNVNADGKALVVITGANQGGKSTFLRSIGLAQLMMQCGMFVGAQAFSAEICPGLYTHYKREEDKTMASGKFDEELARMSAIADHVGPNSILLLNESFAATNEREGSDIAGQIVRALLEKHTKVFYVTHLYEFARSFFDQKNSHALFLRAERKPDGTRPFTLIEGRPLETSYGEDLYREVFENPASGSAGQASAPA
jgi:DNA mismatch repair ATPase MutS